MKALLTIIVGGAVLHHTASALPAVQESATKIAASPYLRVQQEYLQLHCELKFCLQSVQDKDSADKAAQSVKALTERLIILQNKEKQLPSPLLPLSHTSNNTVLKQIIKHSFIKV